MKESLSPEQMKLLAVGELAAGIVHEINTPLQVLSEYIKRIEKNISGEIKEQNQRSFDKVNYTIGFIQKLVKMKILLFLKLRIMGQVFQKTLSKKFLSHYLPPKMVIKELVWVFY